jgi:glutamine amidotransferase
LIAILDYGSGNLRSAQRAFELTDHDVTVTSNHEEFLSADAFVVPGVGAFGACMKQLSSIGGVELVREAISTRKPFFGICVGMQILFSHGTEKGKHEGVGIFEGEVELLKAQVLPHIGWNTLNIVNTADEIFAGVENQMFYFVHSYAVKKAPQNTSVSWSNYSENFLAAIHYDNVFATQFHPEKSGDAGIKLIRNWAERI